jgi:predicted XRE-type DNA-binding protein
MNRDSDDAMRRLRLQLAVEIVRALGPASQHVIAPSFGIPQLRMSELSRGRVDKCTLDWRIRVIHRLGGSVSVSVRLGDVRRNWLTQTQARKALSNPHLSLKQAERRIRF